MAGHFKPPDESAPRVRWKPLTIGGAVAATVALVATLAVIWPGFDAQQTPRENAAVWALQTGEGKRYARVNTQLGELDTIKDVENPSGLIQHDDDLMIFADGFQRFAEVNPATPVDLDGESEELATAPADTVQVRSSGDKVVYLTGSGEVFTSSISDGADTVLIDPYSDATVEEGEDRPTYPATAITVSAGGTVAAYSADEGRVIRADASTGEILGSDTVSAETGDAPEMTFVGNRWVLLEPTTGELWIEGRDSSIQTGVEVGARLQQPGPTADVVLIADANGLVETMLDGSTSERVTDPSVTGIPVAPASQDDVMLAAWLGDGATGGTLWTSDEGTKTLDYGAGELGDEIDAEFTSNGTRTILNETKSGWVWTVPDGALVASSQAWDLDERVPQQLEEVETQRVIDPKPPVAEPDSFGVRAGRDVTLPVLLNDHDPNEDVLSVEPGSLTGLPDDFGSLSVANDNQQIVVSVSPEATGSATFTYQVTDGSSSDGLLSNSATVTLTVAPDDVNTAPVWCGVDGCLSEWPTPQLTPGDTSQTEVLGAWVDPEGDPIYLSETSNPSGVGSVLTNPDGTVTFQHSDPNDADGRTVPLEVTVADVRGAATSKTLSMQVLATPQLTVTPVAVTGVAGTPVTVDLTPHVAGVTGAAKLTSVTPLDESQSGVSVAAAALRFTFTSTSPGSYPIQVTVSDDASEVTNVVRVTLEDPDEAEISTVPLTAFVRPSEDATIDVLPAVSNPAGLVLLVSDLELEPENEATLAVDVIGQQHIRVAGSTDDGQPGTLGVAEYTVSDGSENDRRTATGEITFVLLDATDSTPPIAVDDRITVRAGDQIDIPVLENDSAPAGSQIAIDPASVVNEHEAGLAFGTNRLVRYLAPDEPGTYTVKYTIFRLGFPSLIDSARVHVTVVGEDSNEPPVPNALEGRVLSGSTVSVPFDRFGVDPDGDPAELERITSQPEFGSAAISADGDAILYTSAPGSKGQDRFSYEVRDRLGATGTGEVRIGILDEESDPGPITYSDYVQVQAGAESEVAVYPSENDIDPSGARLELIDVRPNAVNGTDEYRALEARLDGFDSDTGEVRIFAGEELGTSSFVYTVRNSNGDSAMGLIVTKVVREPVPDYPVVRDTKLTAETIEQLPRGIDVLTQKVSWSTGDASKLSLALWDDASDYRVSGSRIAGETPQQSEIVPFEVTGTSFTGAEVTSYGFLRIPGEDDLRLSLRSSFTDLEVKENSEATLDLAKEIPTPQGQELEVLDSGVRASGVRANAECSLDSGTTIRYSAGAGAPWHDSCTVAVKLESQSEYTYLNVRVRVVAEDPQPELRQGSLTVSPGDTVTYDLQQMVSWQGNQSRAGLAFAVAYEGDQFTVTQNGATVAVTATDTAKPSRVEPATVSLTSHPDAEIRTLRLTVGPAPSTLPKGATVTQMCSQSGGQTNCNIPVIGQGGEVNPLPGTPLKLTSVSSPANCSGVTFEVANSTTVRASWRADAPGAADCTGSFVVEDAQGRQSSGDRAGQVVLDLRGLPANPTRLDWTSYTPNSVRLDAVSESSSYPAVTGYRVSGGGQQVTCPASGVCEIGSLQNGNQTEFQVRALNDVGESRASASVTAWAYRAPEAPQMRNSGFVPVENGLEGRRARITVDVSDHSTSRLVIAGADTQRVEVQVPRHGRVDEVITLGSNNPQTVTVTPVTRHALPPAHVSEGSSEGDRLDIPGVHGVGAPIITGLELTPNVDGRSVHASISVETNGASTVLVGFAKENETCRANGEVRETTIPDVDRNRDVTIKACVRHVFQEERFPVREISQVVNLRMPSPTSASFTVAAEPQISNGRIYEWTSVTSHAQRSNEDFELRYSTDQDASRDAMATDIRNVFKPGINQGTVYAFACETSGRNRTCSPGVAMTPTGAPYLPQVTFPEAPGLVCATAPADPEIYPYEARPPVGVIARSNDDRTITVTFPGWNLDPVKWSCVPPPETDEEPTP